MAAAAASNWEDGRYFMEDLIQQGQGTTGQGAPLRMAGRKHRGRLRSDPAGREPSQDRQSSAVVVGDEGEEGGLAGHSPLLHPQHPWPLQRAACVPHPIASSWEALGLPT